MTDELIGYDDWKTRSAEDQAEMDRAWAKWGKRERDPDAERDAARDAELDEQEWSE
ncbi:MAG: hypothetical protein PHS14_13020 [Elusimicrobia bacterium]|nr:hypothetical protein [Elusimicrobiota bacterium]